jgi:hypothetical protein
VQLINKLHFLIEHLDWFECLLEPLFDANLKLVMTKTFKHINELLQRGMALLVKSAISEEFIE